MISKLQFPAALVLICLVVCLCLTQTSKQASLESAANDYSDKALRAAAQLLEINMNVSANACDDFYEFACGQAQRYPDADQNMIASQLARKVHLVMGNLFDRGWRDNPTTSQQLISHLYASCSDSASIQSKGYEPVKQLLAKLGGLPAIGQQSGWRQHPTESTWTQTLAKLQAVGLDTEAFLSVKLGLDKQNSSRYAIYIDVPSENRDLDYYRQAFTEVVNVLMPNRTDEETSRANGHIDAAAELKSSISQVYGFATRQAKKQKSLFETFDLQEDWREKPFEQTNLEALQAMVPSIDWPAFLGQLLQHPIAFDEKVYIYKPELIAKALQLVESTTNFETLEDTVKMDAFLKLLLHLFEHLGDCTGLVRRYLGLASSIEYVRNYIDPETRHKATELVRHLQAAFVDSINEASWISESSKTGALNRVNSLLTFVGYPDELLNETLINQFHASLVLKPDEFAQNYLNIKRWDRARDLSRLIHQDAAQLDSWKLFELATSVNAFYSVDYNSINILPAILQAFLFNPKQANYVNFAAIGFIAGHEIGHAYDTTNVVHDGNCWWDSSTSLGYKQRVECVEQQYKSEQTGRFGDFGWLNSSRTLNENIADNMGAQVAFRAYNRWLANKPAGFEEPKLPFEYNQFEQLTREQLFWVSMAQFFCNSMSPSDIQSRYAGDVHSAPKLRVNIPMSNLADFSKAFDCPLGSAMNPSQESKCSFST